MGQIPSDFGRNPWAVVLTWRLGLSCWEHNVMYTMSCIQWATGAPRAMWQAIELLSKPVKCWTLILIDHQSDAIHLIRVSEPYVCLVDAIGLFSRDACTMYSSYYGPTTSICPASLSLRGQQIHACTRQVISDAEGASRLNLRWYPTSRGELIIHSWLFCVPQAVEFYALSCEYLPKSGTEMGTWVSPLFPKKSSEKN